MIIVDSSAAGDQTITATVEIGGFAVNEMKVWSFVKPQPGDDEVMKAYSVNPPNVYGFGHQAYYNHVVDCILNDTQQLVDGIVYAGGGALEGNHDQSIAFDIFDGLKIQFRYHR